MCCCICSLKLYVREQAYELQYQGKKRLKKAVTNHEVCVQPTAVSRTVVIQQAVIGGGLEVLCG